MMHTGIYAAVLALLYVRISLLTIQQRRESKQLYLVETSEYVNFPAVAHRNFAAYVPLALILLGLNELIGINPIVIHVFGLALLVGRVLHFHGICYQESKTPPVVQNRIRGMQFTLTAIIAMSITLLGMTLYFAFTPYS